jgi:hypothetical protein
MIMLSDNDITMGLFFDPVDFFKFFDILSKEEFQDSVYRQGFAVFIGAVKQREVAGPDAFGSFQRSVAADQKLVYAHVSASIMA